MKSILYSTDNNQRIAPKPWLLALIALYGIWQMGIMFYSGQTLSLFGRILTDINDSITVIMIATGYIASVIINFVFFKQTVAIGRGVIIAALLSTVGIMLPLPQTATAVFFYLSAFCCVFMIGVNYVLETALFDNNSEKKFVFIGTAIIAAGVALLQGEWFNLPFVAFNSVSIAILIVLLLVYCLLPSKIEVETLKIKAAIKQNAVPRTLTLGLYLAIFISTLSLVFGNSFAESISHGVGIFYISGLISTGIFALLVFKFKLSPFKVYTFAFALTAVGFVLATISSNFPVIAYPALILLGTVVLPANMIGLLSNTLFSLSPTRAHSPLLIICALLCAGIQAALLSVLRDNLTLLFAVLSVMAIAMLVLFIAIENRLQYLLRTGAKAENDIKPESCEKMSFDATKTETNTENDNSHAKEDTTLNKNSVDTQKAYKTNLSALSDRENEIVSFILMGYVNSEIAKHMYLSEETVKTYRKRIYQKLDIHSRRELFVLANETEQPII